MIDLLIYVVVLTLIVTGCTFVSADGQTMLVQPEQEAQNKIEQEYLLGALDGCLVAYVYNMQAIGKTITELDKTLIYQSCLNIALKAHSLFRAEPTPTPVVKTSGAL